MINKENLQKYSSAITLSDMEVFVFPELMYSLVLANIMSPAIWQWRERDCFKKLEGKSSYRKLMRLRQFIMDEYEFNLDLETWGLTRQDAELKRFEPFISPDDIAKSNALFGYHGDEYYFDVDIRKHFGLDKYTTDVIPYWKTETVEAMNAFALKSGYECGAGECVSLSALYAAAAFIVCGIPLEDIFMILTPLHSQNFIDLNDGVLTNNRRLVTKSMWFNGTEISNKAQRALRNEQITIIAHCSGYVHCFYDQATIDRKNYERLIEKLNRYLKADLDLMIFANFLRCHHRYQEYFQACRDCRGKPQFIKAEILFHYEHGSSYRIADATHDKLLEEVEEEDFVFYELPGRIRCDQLDAFLKKVKPDITQPKGRARLKAVLEPVIPAVDELLDELTDFIYIEPTLPSVKKNVAPTKPVCVDSAWDREQIIDYLDSIRMISPVADLAFYAWRDMARCDWVPFIKAAVERSPVSLEWAKAMNIDEIYQQLGQMPDQSIYDSTRLAHPDEVANYLTGDGLEKAFLLANCIRNWSPEQTVRISVDNNKVTVSADKDYEFGSTKQLTQTVMIDRDGTIEAG